MQILSFCVDNIVVNIQLDIQHHDNIQITQLRHENNENKNKGLSEVLMSLRTCVQVDTCVLSQIVTILCALSACVCDVC